MSINDTLHAQHNCYLSTTFILRNKTMFTMSLKQNWIYSVKSWDFCNKLSEFSQNDQMLLPPRTRCYNTTVP